MIEFNDQRQFIDMHIAASRNRDKCEQVLKDFNMTDGRAECMVPSTPPPPKKHSKEQDCI